jgi:hypothetical protein
VKFDRKEFVRKAGFGAITLASLPALGNALAMPAGAAAEEERVYYLVAFSKAMVSGAEHRFALSGAGGFSPSRGTVRGWGTYVYVNFSAPGTPKPLLASGRWRATKFLTYGHQVGSSGAVRPSIVDMQIDLMPQPGARITGATLRLICNVGYAGLMTGEPEGFKLTIPGTPGMFEPLDPPLGITHIGVP